MMTDDKKEPVADLVERLPFMELRAVAAGLSARGDQRAADMIIDAAKAAAADAASKEAEIAELRAANSTRPDYDLTCQECGRAHILDTSLPSDIWNQIAEPGDVLCTLCIDRRLTAKGLTALAEFYYGGAALRSKLYGSDAQSEATHFRKGIETLLNNDPADQSLERVRDRLKALLEEADGK